MATTHTALYRKYRPEAFDEVIGQEHIVDVLRASIENGKIAHAYLLTGGRGTGKTTIARIIARALGTSANDLYEMDAASNNSVDDVRELRENVRSLPFDSKYKVYILDEVHMLSKAAFNALLKTLEEPPAHVIFILATTELEKVPETIISRCQTFSFRKPTEKILRDLAVSIAKREGVTLDAGAAELVALLGDGSFRDTYGILQKVFSYSKDRKISVAEVEHVTGAPAESLVADFIEGFLVKDGERATVALETANRNHTDMKVFALRALHLFRTLLLMRIAPKERESLVGEMGETSRAFVNQMLADYPHEITSKNLARLITATMAEDRTAIPGLGLLTALAERTETSD